MKKLKSGNGIPLFKNSLTLQQYAGLEYVTIIHIPVIRIGDSHPSPLIRTHSKINEAVAKAILRKNLPIRGKELKFFRKDVLKLSFDKFAKELEITLVTVFNWEKEATQPLHPINELAIRALMAEKLSLSLKIRLRNERPSPIPFKISAKKLVKLNEL